MSSELFESREDDLRHICENVRKKLTDQLPRCVGGGCGCTNGSYISYINLFVKADAIHTASFARSRVCSQMR